MTDLTTAQNLLLAPANLRLHDLEQVLAHMMSHSIDYADLYFQYTRSEGWSLEEGQVKSGSFAIEQGVGVRAVSGEKTAFAYSDDIALASLQEAANVTRAITTAGQSRRCHLKTKPTQSQLYLGQDPLSAFSAQQKIALLERLERYTKGLDSRVSKVSASLAAEYDVVLVARHDGLIRADVRPLVRLSLHVIAEEHGRREQGYAGGGGRFDYAYFSDEVLHQYAQRAVHEAVVNLSSVAAPAGAMTVVLGSGWPGILLHEAIGHGLEGDFNRKGSSAFSQRLGQQVAARGITIVDDGTLTQRRGSLQMDDEGNPTQRTVLIEDGFLRGYLQDSQNARLMNMPLTGNARRESFAHLPMPRMTNTYMLGGDISAQEIIASVQRGLYAANFGGGQVDITSGKFVFNASEAYLIENGKITHPVKGATLIGNGPEVLKQVRMIGNDMALDSGVGTCGKEGQSVPVGVGQPTLKIDGLTVGGTA